MSWTTFFQNLIVAGMNVLLAWATHQVTGSPAASAGAIAVGTAVAHALPSPYLRGSQKQ
jgi:hypothetical protein